MHLIEIKNDRITKRGATIGKYANSKIFDSHGTTICKIEGDKIRDKSGRLIARVDNNNLRDPGGKTISQMDKIRKDIDGVVSPTTLAAIWMCFLR